MVFPEASFLGLWIIIFPCVLTSGEANGNPLQYSCLENLMDRGAWQATGCRNSLIQLSAYTVIPLIVCVLISSYKDTSQIGIEPTLRASF